MNFLNKNCVNSLYKASSQYNRVSFTVILLYFIFIQQAILEKVDNSFCCSGCIDCVTNDFQQYKCNQCNSEIGFQLDQTKSICIYEKCLENLYYQEYIDNKNTQNGQCISKCGNKYTENPSTNTCDKLYDCSTYSITSNKIQLERSFIEANQLENGLIQIIQKGQITVVNKEDGKVQKTTNFSEDILYFKTFNSKTFILTNKGIVYLWDTFLDTKKQIAKIEETNLEQITLVLVSQNFVCLAVPATSKNQIVFTSIYNLKSLQTTTTSFNYTFINQGNLIKSIEDILLILNLRQLFLIQITAIEVTQKIIIKFSEPILVKEQQENILINNFLNFKNSNLYILALGNQPSSFFQVSSQSKQVQQSQQLADQQSIQQIRIITNQLINTNLIVVLSLNLVVYNDSLTIVQNLLEVQFNAKFLNIEVIQFDQSSSELAVLTDQNQLLLFQINNKLQLDLMEQLDLNINQLQGFYVISNFLTQNSSSNFGLLIKTSIDLQLIWRNLNTKQISYNAFSNFQYLYPSSLGEITQLVIIDAYQLLAACVSTGFIQIYDISSGYYAEQYNIIVLTEGCVSMENVQSKYILIQQLTKFALLDFINGITIKEIPMLLPNSLYSVNGLYTLLNTDDCFQVFENNFFNLVFQKCNQSITQQNLQVIISSNQEVIIQKQQKLIKVTLNLTQQSFDNIKEITFDSVFNYFNIAKSQVDTTNNSFQLDEVIVYEQNQLLSIVNIDFITTYSITTEAKNPNHIKRVVNDQNQYFLMESYTIDEQSQYLILSFTKVQQILTETYKYQGYLYTPFIDDPIIVNFDDGSQHYLLRQYLFLNFLTVIIDIIFPVDQIIKGKELMNGYTYTFYGDTYLTRAILQDNIDKRSMYYVASTNGQISVTDGITSKYQIYRLSQYLKANDDQIILTIQSPYIEKYFVQLKSSLLVFNIFTDEFIEQIPFEEASNYNRIQILENLNAAIYQSKNKLTIRYFDSLNANTFVFTKLDLIREWFYSEKDSIFFVYGNGYFMINLQFTITNTLVPLNEHNIVKCLNIANQSICLSDNSFLLFIDLITKSVTQTIQIQGFSSNNILFEIDQDNQLIFLVQNSIQVYTLQGVLSQKISLFVVGVYQVEIVDKYIFIVTKPCIVIHSRKTLQYKSQLNSPAGFNILKYIYIDQSQQIVFFCDSAIFSQVFLFDIKQQLIIGRINQAYTENGVGNIVDIIFDKEVTSIIYLDDLGNICVNLLYNSFETQGEIINYDIQQAKTTPQGISFSFITGNGLIYTKDTIYKFNYFNLQDKCETSFQNPSLFRTAIQIQDNSNTLQYLVLGANNYIFRYQDYQLIYEASFKEMVFGVRYIQSLKFLLIIFAEHIKIYKSYSYGNYESFLDVQTSPQIYFKKFIDDDIILTYDSKLLHYDYANNQIIKDIQFPSSSIHTKTFLNSSKNTIIIGFQSGIILIYYKDARNSIIIDALKDLKSPAVKKAIKFVIELDLENVLISTIQGEIIQFNLRSQQIIKTFNIYEEYLSMQNIQKLRQVNDFVIDQKTNRLYFMFFKSKIAYAWSLTDSKILGNMISCNFQDNRILLTNTFIIMKTASCLNLYQREGRLQLLGQIRGDYFMTTITQIVELNSQFFAICYSYQFYVYYLKNYQPIMIQKQYINYPVILEYSLISKDIFKLLFLSSNGVIELQISINNYISSNSDICAYSISSQDSSILQQQIQMVQPKMLEVFIEGGRNVVPSTNQQINLYIQASSDIILFLNSVLLNLSNSYPYSIKFSSLSAESNQFTLNQDIFSSIQQKEWNLSDYDFMISEDCNNIDNSCQDIKFDEQTEQIKWQNIKIQQLNNISRARIKFTNLKSVTIFDLEITQNFDSTSKRERVLGDIISDESDCFLYFENVEKVYLYNIKINSNENISSLFNLITIKSVKQVQINNLEIAGNKNLNDLIGFYLVDKIIINTLKIKDNIFLQSFQNKFIITFNACLDVLINGMTSSSNVGYKSIMSSNIYMQELQIINYTQDKFAIKSSNVTQNTNVIQSNIILQNSYVVLDSLNYLENDGNLRLDSSKEITISNSVFQFNKDINGGAISMYNIQKKIEISKTLIQSNTAQGSGGGLYIEDLYTQDLIIDQLSFIQFNQAHIGGGIRIFNKQSTLSPPNQYPFKSNIINNLSEIYGDNTATILQNIVIKSGNTIVQEDSMNSAQKLELNKYEFKYTQNDKSNQYYGQIDINSYKSGGILLLNIYLFDDDQKLISFKKDSISENLYNIDIEEEIKQINIQTDLGNSKNIQLTGETILNFKMFNESLQIFQFKELQISGMPETSQQFYLQITLNKYQKQNIKLLVNVNFRSCKQGEILMKPSQNINICYFCSEGTYSLANPHQNNASYTIENSENQQSNECKKCPDSAKLCEGNQIKIRNGYWRKYNTTDEILECDSNLNSCQPENYNSSSEGCTEGYTGPICEECDLMGQIWNKNGKRYISSFYSKVCRLCSDITYQYVFFIIQIFIMLVYFIYNSKKFILNFQYTLQCYYLRKISLLPISKDSASASSSSFIKIILTYLQFSSLLISQPSLLPIQLNIIPNILGSSNKVITLSLSCVFSTKSYEESGKAIIFGMINFLTPLIFIVLCVGFLQLVKVQQISPCLQKYVKYTLISVIYTFFQVDIVQFFTMMLTCRDIGSNSYHSVDLLKYCSDSEIQRVVFPLSASILAIWSLSPLIVLYYLRQKRDKLDYCQQKLKYGFFYQEMKLKYYFWEFVRIYLKIFVIIVYTLLRQNYMMLSRFIVIYIFAQYVKIITVKQPFQQAIFSQTEVYSFQVLVAKLFLVAFKENITGLVILFEIIQYLVDYFFLIYLLINVIKLTVYNKDSILAKILILIINKFSIRYYLKLTKNIDTNFKTYLRWKKVKLNLKNILHFRANQHLIQNSKLQKTMSDIHLDLDENYVLIPFSSTQRKEERTLSQNINSPVASCLLSKQIAQSFNSKDQTIQHVRLSNKLNKEHAIDNPFSKFNVKKQKSKSSIENDE